MLEYLIMRSRAAAKDASLCSNLWKAVALEPLGRFSNFDYLRIAEDRSFPKPVQPTVYDKRFRSYGRITQLVTCTSSAAVL